VAKGSVIDASVRKPDERLPMSYTLNYHYRLESRCATGIGIRRI
jgi:hypothetical protein